MISGRSGRQRSTSYPVIAGFSTLIRLSRGQERVALMCRGGPTAGPIATGGRRPASQDAARGTRRPCGRDPGALWPTGSPAEIARPAPSARSLQRAPAGGRCHAALGPAPDHLATMLPYSQRISGRYVRRAPTRSCPTKLREARAARWLTSWPNRHVLRSLSDNAARLSVSTAWCP
jgi:hypothetical protein